MSLPNLPANSLRSHRVTCFLKHHEWEALVARAEEERKQLGSVAREIVVEAMERRRILFEIPEDLRGLVRQIKDLLDFELRELPSQPDDSPQTDRYEVVRPRDDSF